MTRRMDTRSGDRAAVKLAYDIHTLLSVIKGMDLSIMKDLISNSKRNNNRKTSVSQALQSCQCKAEIVNLKEIVTSLQSDLLLVKQRQAATENIRYKDSSEFKTSISNVKTSINSVKADVNSTQERMQTDI